MDSVAAAWRSNSESYISVIGSPVPAADPPSITVKLSVLVYLS